MQTEDAQSAMYLYHIEIYFFIQDIAIGRVVIGEDIAARVDTGQNMGFQNDMRAISR